MNFLQRRKNVKENICVIFGALTYFREEQSKQRDEFVHKYIQCAAKEFTGKRVREECQIFGRTLSSPRNAMYVTE